jgi:glutaminase
LRDIFDGLRHLNDGRVATYIPELAKAKPEHFGIVLATADGEIYEVGDSRVEFTIQSISKPFVYALALEDHGEAAVMRRVGVEPTGEAFNSIVLDETNNRPFNPMVNAGAIATAALIKGDDGEARLNRMMAKFSRFAGRSLTIDEEVFRSERDTGHRNRAIAYLELNAGMIDEPVAEHLDLYFRQCSIRVTARDLAVMAATLANHGCNPLTGERALAAEFVKSVLSVMASCGMYDASGEWLYRVGLPAKSGVGGGIIAVLPGQVGVGVFSPLLDPQGNSYRGVRVCEELSRRFNLHLFDAFSTGNAAIRRSYDGRTVSSKRQRRAWERAVLKRRGAEIVVYELQSDLYFAAIERVLRRLSTDVDTLSYLILDGRRVGRVDLTALSLFARIRDVLNAAGKPLLLCGFSASILSSLDDGGEVSWLHFEDTDTALEWCESRLLRASDPGIGDVEMPLSLAAMDVLAAFTPEDLAVVERFLDVRGYAAGEAIVREGEAADRLYFLAAGSAIVTVRVTEGSPSSRLNGFGPGVVFGELAVFQGGKRTANVIAETKTLCYVFTLASLAALAAEHPAVYGKLLLGVGRSLSERLRQATAEIRALRL